MKRILILSAGMVLAGKMKKLRTDAAKAIARLLLE